MDFTELGADIYTFIQNVEGPYKWYVMMGVLAVLTLFFTRFVFKTIRWFLMLAAILVILVAIVAYFFQQ